MPVTRSQCAIESDCLQDEANEMVEQVQKGGAVCEDTESNASEIRLLLAEQKDIMKIDQIAQRQFMDETRQWQQMQRSFMNSLKSEFTNEIMIINRWFDDFESDVYRKMENIRQEIVEKASEEKEETLEVY